MSKLQLPFEDAPRPWRPRTRLRAAVRWRAGAAAAVLLGLGLGGVALGFGLLPHVLPAEPPWLRVLTAGGALVGGCAALIAAGRSAFVARYGRRPGSWRSWLSATAANGDNFEIID